VPLKISIGTAFLLGLWVTGLASIPIVVAEGLIVSPFPRRVSVGLVQAHPELLGFGVRGEFIKNVHDTAVLSRARDSGQMISVGLTSRFGLVPGEFLVDDVMILLANLANSPHFHGAGSIMPLHPSPSDSDAVFI